MRKYGESKTTRIMMATVPHVIYGLGLRKFQDDGFLLTRVYLLRIYFTSPPIWRVPASILNKQSQIAEGCSSRLGIWAQKRDRLL